MVNRPVIGNAAFTLVAHSPGSVYQDQSTTAYPDARGSRVSVSVAPAENLMDAPDDEIVDRILSDIGKLHPLVKRTFLHKSLVLRHPHHLVRPLPGVMASRPPNATPVRNLFLAGDWTNQPFFGSQKGAVRSGRMCAEAILSPAAQ